MNITSPLSARQLDLSIDTQSLVKDIAGRHPAWIQTLIIETLNSSLVPLSNRSLRELIGVLCPAEIPEHSDEIEWASRKIMQERLQQYIESRVVTTQPIKTVPTSLATPLAKFNSSNSKRSRHRVRRKFGLKRKLRALGVG